MQMGNEKWFTIAIKAIWAVTNQVRNLREILIEIQNFEYYVIYKLSDSVIF